MTEASGGRSSLNGKLSSMSLPFFYLDQLNAPSVVLDEDTSKHVVQVLRMKKGEELLLTDGKGTRARAVISDDNRKRCEVTVIATEKEEERKHRVTIAISLLKNASRFEWFLEKATEIGVSAIIPLMCERTEKERFRHDRMKSILVSAMLQSQQSFLPELHHPTEFSKLLEQGSYENKFIAHCLPEQKSTLPSLQNTSSTSIILIGPEGDFTSTEIQQALGSNYLPVSLGNTRLRTETAGIVAATLLV
jgi:16S rRNA (uracil1498-N3)-methyltransferase